MLPGGARIIRMILHMFPGLDQYHVDLAQHIITALEKLEDLGHDLSKVCTKPFSAVAKTRGKYSFFSGMSYVLYKIPFPYSLGELKQEDKHTSKLLQYLLVVRFDRIKHQLMPVTFLKPTAVECVGHTPTPMATKK